MGKAARVTDEELVETLRDSPWEREQRRCAEVSSVPCKWCGMMAAVNGPYCSEFCEMCADIWSAES